MGTYYIAFDTKDMPGKIKATRVTLDQEIIGPGNKEYAIDLCDHPLYPQLARYVKDNPPRERGR